jgi:hypothetical protein
MTNYHVAGDRGSVMVYFPAYQDGELVTDSRNKDQLGLVGTLRAGSARKDLAILELDRIPDGVVPLPLAPPSPRILTSWPNWRRGSKMQTLRNVWRRPRNSLHWARKPGRSRRTLLPD